MMRLLTVALAVCLFASPVLAADAPAGPEKLPAKNGDVTFNHKSHASQKCDVCHEGGKTGKIGPMDQQKAHGLCVDCHKKDAAAKAPTKCPDCHKKA